ncbi:DNA-binding protein [Roseateles sp. So40a]|uniref:DNA-binding protein n=1 Tax=Roseateles sp. So40a TaxID=3400226 RepID=UPI003A8682F4
MSQMHLKKTSTAQEIKRDFHRRGVSIADWAKSRGFDADLVYVILGGKRKCLRGESHRIAVALGLKSEEE